MSGTLSLRECPESSISECSDVQALIGELRQCQMRFFSELGRMAAIVKRLDELGVEVAIENSMLSYVRLIAHGQLSQSLFATWHCEPRLLDAARQLPLPVQEKVANNDPFKVMELNGDHRLVRPGDMTRNEIRQVFSGKRLRTEAEQVGWLRHQLEKTAARTSRTDQPEVMLDKKRKGIVANGVFISLSRLAGFVSDLSR